MPARHPPRPSPRRDARDPSRATIGAEKRRPGRRAWLGAGFALAVVLALATGFAWDRDRPRRLLGRAEAATLAEAHAPALDAWRAYHATGQGDARTWLAEARAALALGRSAEADRAFERALAADPSESEAWRARLDRLRVLDRPLEALRLGRLGVEAVAPESRAALLATTTLAALAELPDDEARSRLGRWISADPADLDARVARLARVAAGPHPGDPDRASRIDELAAILEAHPGHVAAREALVVALGDAGEVDRGREALDAWPPDARDARYDRLRGRWDLDYDHDPAGAERSFARVLIDLPHDWKSHYGLARALRALGREAESRSEAETVARVRERLEPAALGPRLAGDLGRLGEPSALLDLAGLCEGVGLADLAASWRRETLAASTASGPPPPGL